MLTKCGCAIYVHLQLDLLKFYLAILKKKPLVLLCVFVASHCSPWRFFVMMKCRWGLIWVRAKMNHMFIKYKEQAYIDDERRERTYAPTRGPKAERRVWWRDVTDRVWAVSAPQRSLTYIPPDCYSPRCVRREPEMARQQKMARMLWENVAVSWADGHI